MRSTWRRGRLSAVGCWLLAIGYWLLAVGVLGPPLRLRRKNQGAAVGVTVCVETNGTARATMNLIAARLNSCWSYLAAGNTHQPLMRIKFSQKIGG
jgi:hypothetical protein